jgi:hypothetical protein
MPKHDPVEAALDRLSALRSAGETPALLDDLRTFLKNRSNLVVAKAAKLAGERRLSALSPDLVVAAQRLLKDPARLDKRCAALTEILRSLYELDFTEPHLYLQCLGLVQMEPSFGSPVDAAANLRGFSAQGLVRTNHPEALELVVDLLADPEPPARIGAVRALACNGGAGGRLALRLKILTGDRVADVTAECFSGILLNSDGPPSENTVAFVAGYIHSEDDAIAEAAILALGASHSPKAIAHLKEMWARLGPGRLKKVLLLALATSRSEDALTFLLSLLESAPNSTAAEVLAALAAQRPSPSIRHSIQAALTRRRNPDPALLASFARDFSDSST